LIVGTISSGLSSAVVFLRTRLRVAAAFTSIATHGRNRAATAFTRDTAFTGGAAFTGNTVFTGRAVVLDHAAVFIWSDSLNATFSVIAARTSRIFLFSSTSYARIVCIWPDSRKVVYRRTAK
jgi:hypothetical protein